MLLSNDTASALETVGLDPYVGFLIGTAGGLLALDVMEGCARLCRPLCIVPYK